MILHRKREDQFKFLKQLLLSYLKALYHFLISSSYAPTFKSHHGLFLSSLTTRVSIIWKIFSSLDRRCILIEIASVVRGSKRIWKKINSNQRSNSIQFSSEADRPRSWIELNLIWGLNLFSFKMSLLPRTTEAIYFKHHE